MIPTTSFELVADRQARYLHEATQHRLARSARPPIRRHVDLRFAALVTRRLEMLTFRPVVTRGTAAPAPCIC